MGCGWACAARRNPSPPDPLARAREEGEPTRQVRGCGAWRAGRRPRCGERGTGRARLIGEDSARMRPSYGDGRVRLAQFTLSLSKGSRYRSARISHDGHGTVLLTKRERPSQSDRHIILGESDAGKLLEAVVDAGLGGVERPRRRARCRGCGPARTGRVCCCSRPSRPPIGDSHNHCSASFLQLQSSQTL